MAQQQRALEGDVVEPKGDAAESNRLRDLNRGLMRELDDALKDNESLRKRVAMADAPVARLREKLEPFYKLLQAIFGDIEELGPDSLAGGNATTQAQPSRSSSAWESWKQRMPGAPAKIIDALLTHADASVEQLVVLTGITRKQTIYDAVRRLNKSGLINKNGGRFALKQL